MSYTIQSGIYPQTATAIAQRIEYANRVVYLVNQADGPLKIFVHARNDAGVEMRPNGYLAGANYIKHT